jgi:predicted Zn-dependent protease with MMP-like domain
VLPVNHVGSMVGTSANRSRKEPLLRRARHGRRPPRPRLRLPVVQPPGSGREAFMRLVEEAVESIPEQFRDRLANVDFVIEETPRGDEVPGGELLLGLYQGVPLTERGAGYFGVLPDRIVLFRRPIEARARSDADLAELVREVVIHEVAHYFGIDDDRLDELGW